MNCHLHSWSLQYACFPLHGNVTLTEFRVSLCTAEVVRLSWLQTCHAESDAHPECAAVSESRADKVSWVLRASEPLHSNFCARGSACSAQLPLSTAYSSGFSADCEWILGGRRAIEWEPPNSASWLLTSFESNVPPTASTGTLALAFFNTWSDLCTW